MKTQAELTELLDFIGEYATYLLGSGVHTSRVVRNARRIGASQSVDVRLTTFQRTSILTVREEGNPQVVTQVVEIPHLPISFERNSDLSSLSWEAVDRRLPLDVIREKFRKLTAKPRMDPMFVLMVVGLANASFCKLFNGDWVAVGIVFTCVEPLLEGDWVTAFWTAFGPVFFGIVAWIFYSRAERKHVLD